MLSESESDSDDEVINTLSNKKSNGGQQKGKHMCPECGARYTKEFRLKNHVLTHSGIRPYKCNVPGCDKAYSHQKHLHRHSFTHQQANLPCTFEGCTKIYRRTEELNRHFNKHSRYKCDQCEAVFSIKGQLTKHLNGHAGIDKPYVCAVKGCEYAGGTYKLLWAHEKAMHKEGLEVVCRHIGCDYVAATISVLKKHVANNHPNNFNSAKNLNKVNKESNKSDDGRQFKCKECGLSFTKSYQLTDHVKHIHSEEKEVFKCLYDGCGKEFAKSCNLKYHEEAVHLNIKRFVCSYTGCNFDTYYKSKMELHSRLHCNNNSSFFNIEEYHISSMNLSEFENIDFPSRMEMINSIISSFTENDDGGGTPPLMLPTSLIPGGSPSH